MVAVWGSKKKKKKGLSVVLFERKLDGVLFLRGGYRKWIVVIFFFDFLKIVIGVVISCLQHQGWGLAYHMPNLLYIWRTGSVSICTLSGRGAAGFPVEEVESSWCDCDRPSLTANWREEELMELSTTNGHINIDYLFIYLSHLFSCGTSSL